MITFEQNENSLCATVFGEFTLADIKQFEEQVCYRIEFKGGVNLLLDLRDMTGYTLDVAWEEIKFAKSHPESFNKIAVLTDSQWLSSLAWLSNVFTSAEILVFEEPESAQEWLSV